MNYLDVIFMDKVPPEVCAQFMPVCEVRMVLAPAIPLLIIVGLVFWYSLGTRSAREREDEEALTRQKKGIPIHPFTKK